MNKYVFSVIMPIYNEGILIEKVLQSYIIQPYDDFEIVIVDDGSTDECSEICDRYAKQYDFVKVYHKENSGCVLARKFGIDHALGEYLVFADGDDYVLETYMRDLHNAVKNTADLYVLNNSLIKANGKDQYVEKDFLSTGYIEKEILYTWILSAKAGAVWDKIFLSTIIKENNIQFDCQISYGEDIYINLKYLEYVNKVYVQNTASYIHTLDSTTSICVHDINARRFKEIDVLFSEVNTVYKKGNCTMEDFNRFAYVTLRNLITTIYSFKNNGVSNVNIRKLLDSISCTAYFYKEYTPRNIKGYFYSWLFNNHHYLLILWLFKYKKV